MDRNIDETKIEKAVKTILEAIGEDPDRAGLKDTPSRVAKMCKEITCGMGQDASRHLACTFESDGNGLVLEKDIDFSSTCEHHLMPFFGRVHIAYVPNGRVVGLSKLARTVEVYARRLQMQERMTSEIADAVFNELKPKSVLVIVEAEHTCMTTRGIKKVGSKTMTYAVRGNMDENTVNRVFASVGKEKIY